MHVIIVQQIKKEILCHSLQYYDTDIGTCLPIKCEHDKIVFDPLVYQKLSPKKI